ncbi:hypothetical protein B7486_06220 [cyanobacterium TDX16]|nr:hypothetical protein B7486_06220 [cyanobacterium TDX16]
MKKLNFRLYDTQATASMLAAMAGMVVVLGLVVVVFKGIDTEQMVIPYNAELGMSQYRQPIIMASVPLAIVLGLTGGILGFRSLGQAKNTKQGRSWMGMTMGAFVVAIAPVLFGTWKQLSEPMIIAPKDSPSAVATP